MATSRNSAISRPLSSVRAFPRKARLEKQLEDGTITLVASVLARTMRFQRTIIAASLTILLGAAQAETSPQTIGDRRATELIRRYNLRNTGSPGWRRVNVFFRSGNTATRAYTISNFWNTRGDTSRMLFYLEEPAGLRRTRYLQVEDQTATQELGVYLYLPAGSQQVLTIAPGAHGQGLLGSDFSYSDLRLTLPVHDCTYRFRGTQMLAGRRTWKIESVPSRHKPPWTRAILYFTQDRLFLLGADYYSSPESSGSEMLLKSMRVEEFRDVGSVRTAVRMTMSARGGNSTSIVLQKASFGARAIPEEWLTPSTLSSPALDEAASWPTGTRSGGSK
jgi:hypothetical protein